MWSPLTLNTTEDLQNFDQYTARFARLVGPYQEGQYGHYKGRLVRRLGQADFAVKIAEYLELGERFSAMIQSGDTIDTTVAADLRATEIELVFEESLFFPTPARL